MHHQWHWGENATWRRSQGGLLLSCDGHWRAHNFQDDDGQTQTSVSWGRRPPSPPPSFPPSPLPPPQYIIASPWVGHKKNTANRLSQTAYGPGFTASVLRRRAIAQDTLNSARKKKQKTSTPVKIIGHNNKLPIKFKYNFCFTTLSNDVFHSYMIEQNTRFCRNHTATVTATTPATTTK